jgi:glycosyltransferase involved in cell wall biosynthesis
MLAAPLPLPTVLDAATCGSLRAARAAERAAPLASVRARAALPALRRAERAAAHRFGRLLVAAESDAAALRALLGDEGGAVHVVPSILDVERFAPPLQLRDPATLLLDLRGLGRAETRAALGLAAAAMPQVWAQRGDVRLTVAGPFPFGAAGRLAGDPRVVFTGPVHDPRGHLAAATLVLAPLSPAASAPHAALEAMACGAALVAGAHLASDLAATPGEELLVADTPAQLAAAALALLDDAPYRGRVGRAGRRLVEREHRWERGLYALENVYAAATGSPIAEWRLEVGLDRAVRHEPEA